MTEINTRGAALAIAKRADIVERVSKHIERLTEPDALAEWLPLAIAGTEETPEGTAYDIKFRVLYVER